MNPALGWIFGIASSVLAGVLIQYFYIPFRLSQAMAATEEKQKRLTVELDELRQGLVTNREIQDQRYFEFYREYQDFRVKVAAKTGVNGR